MYNLGGKKVFSKNPEFRTTLSGFCVFLDCFVSLMGAIDLNTRCAKTLTCLASCELRLGQTMKHKIERCTLKSNAK